MNGVALGRRLLRLWDPMRIEELDGVRVVFTRLRTAGFLDGLQGRRILEIGPKHGEDSRQIATLNPAELVLLDLPSKHDLASRWLPEVQKIAPVRYVAGNLLYLGASEMESLGRFDLVWCTGVIYHNAEQLRLVRRLFDLCTVGGRVVIESEVVRKIGLRHRNLVEVYWPRPWNGILTMTHLPTTNAIRSWMEIVGFSDVRTQSVYSRRLRRTRAVLTGERSASARSAMSYDNPANPEYGIGHAT